MPRARRISWLNYPHLVIAEANGGAKLFVEPDDYYAYMELLRQIVRDRLLKIFAFCLMENEIRLVVEPKRLMLSRVIQRLHGKHTARMNKVQNRRGHLFRGRFRSLVFNQCDLLEVVKSVHLWPVRAGLLRRPELYPYSSHATYMGVNQLNRDFLSSDEVFSQFFGDKDTKSRAFGRSLELSALDADNYGLNEIQAGIGGNQESFSDLIKKANKNKDLVPKKSSVKILAERAGLLLGISCEQIVSQSRRQDLVMARRLLATAAIVGAQRSITEVAGFLQRDKSQISRLVAQGLDLLDANEPFSAMFDSLKARGALVEQE